MLEFPDPNKIYPDDNVKSIVFLKNVVTNPNIEVREYTYFSDKEPEKFEEHVTHHYDFINDKLIIGKFCSIGENVEFVMNGANHLMKGITSYPFYIMGDEWSKHVPQITDLPNKGNTIIENDVWIGQNVTILPGVHIENGAIIGANSVVATDVSAYSIVAGNPAKQIRKRFSNHIIKHLQSLAWWNKDVEWISKNIDYLMTGTISEEKIDELN
ncbi:CatB-related O-acetyltransferase [Leuconostoc carnosum]|uniref:CatB-related O-acetyltransferase n=1 Tax=Leuconostoc carnosum TaxID=1252 RepID=UPI00123B6FD0|nr:CatB-related O-acetyltransferase [Leuconostoc carnosum]KAA8370998.1 CatB-related O-acetyltransferase [Leuconostoc carnosum]KAA8382642.1 CatB-related O-acetyltransferase [Leuconostoc carnosum]